MVSFRAGAFAILISAYSYSPAIDQNGCNEELNKIEMHQMEFCRLFRLSMIATATTPACEFEPYITRYCSAPQTKGAGVMENCPYCGSAHGGKCGLVKALEYYPDGTVKRVEFYGPSDSMPNIVGGQPWQLPYDPSKTKIT